MADPKKIHLHLQLLDHQVEAAAAVSSTRERDGAVVTIDTTTLLNKLEQFSCWARLVAQFIMLAGDTRVL
jgi:hypothetical protein